MSEYNKYISIPWDESYYDGRGYQNVHTENLIDLNEWLRNRSDTFFKLSYGGILTDQRAIRINGIDFAYLCNDMIRYHHDPVTNEKFFYFDFAPKLFSSDKQGRRRNLFDLIERQVMYTNLGLCDTTNYTAITPRILPRSVMKYIDDDTLYLSDDLYNEYIEFSTEDGPITSSCLTLFNSLSKIVLGLMDLNCIKPNHIDDGVNPTIITSGWDSFASINPNDGKIVRLLLKVLRKTYSDLTNNKLNLSIPFKGDDATGSFTVSGNQIGSVHRMTFKEFFLLVLPIIRLSCAASPVTYDKMVNFPGIASCSGLEGTDMEVDDSDLITFDYGLIDLKETHHYIDFTDYNVYFESNLLSNGNYGDVAGSDCCHLGANPCLPSEIKNMDMFNILEVDSLLNFSGSNSSSVIYPYEFLLATKFNKAIDVRIIRDEPELYNSNGVLALNISSADQLNSNMICFNTRPSWAYWYTDVEAFFDSYCTYSQPIGSVTKFDYEIEYDRLVRGASLIESPERKFSRVVEPSSVYYLSLSSDDFASATKAWFNSPEECYAYLSRLESILIDSLMRNHNIYSYIVDSIEPQQGYSPTLLAYSLDNLQSNIADKATKKLALIDTLLGCQTSDEDELFINDLSSSPDNVIYYIYDGGLSSTRPTSGEFIAIRINSSEVESFLETMNTSLSSGSQQIPYVFTGVALGGNFFVELQYNKYSDGLISIDATNGKFYCRQDNAWAQMNKGTIITVRLNPNYMLSLNLYTTGVTIDGKAIDTLSPTIYNYDSGVKTVVIEATSNTYIKNLILSDISENVLNSIYNTLCTDGRDSSTDMLSNYADGLADNVAAINECSLIDQISILTEDYIKVIGEDNLSVSDLNSIIDSLIANSEAEFEKLANQIGDSGIYIKKLVNSNVSNCKKIASKVKDSFLSAKTSTGSFISACGARVNNLTARIQAGITGCSDLFSSILGVNQEIDDGLGWSNPNSYTNKSSVALALSASYDLSGILKVGACLGKLIDDGITWVYNKCSDFVAETFVDGVSYKVNASGFECLDIPAYQKKMNLDAFHSYNNFMYKRFINLINQGMDKFTIVTQVNTVLVFYQYHLGEVYVSYSPILYNFDYAKNDHSDYDLLKAIVTSRIDVVKDYNSLITILNSISQNLSREFAYLSQSGISYLPIPDEEELYKYVFKGATVSYVEKHTTNVKKYCATTAAVAGVCLLIPGIRWFAAAALAVSAVVAAYSELVEEVCTTDDINRVLEEATNDSTFANTQIETYELLSLNSGYDTRVFDLYNQIIDKLGYGGFVSCGDGNLSINGKYVPMAEFMNTPSFKFHLYTDEERARQTRLRLLVIAAAVAAYTISAFKVTKGLRLSAKKNSLTTKLFEMTPPDPDNEKYADLPDLYLLDKEKYRKNVSKTLKKISRVEKKLGIKPSSSIPSLSTLMNDDSSRKIISSLIKSSDSNQLGLLSEFGVVTSLINSSDSNNKDNLDRVNTSINEQASQNLRSLEETLTGLETRLKLVMNDLSVIASNAKSNTDIIMNDVTSNFSNISNELSSITNKIELLIDELSTDVSTNGDQIDALKSLVNSINMIVNESKVTITKIDKSVDSISNVVDSSNKDISDKLVSIDSALNSTKDDITKVGDTLVNRSDIVEV